MLIFDCSYMGIGPSISNYFRETHDFSTINAKVAGAVIGGVISATLSHPIDTLKVKFSSSFGCLDVFFIICL